MFNQSKTCPLVTIAARLDGKPGAVIPCLGKSCAWFLEFGSAYKGQDGKCVLYALASIEYTGRATLKQLEIGGSINGASVTPEDVPF